MIQHLIRKSLTWVGTATSHPAAFVIVLLYAIGWVLFDSQSLDWHGAATLATWLMTLFIQRAEHRDTQALHAKLDELLKVNGDADDSIVRIDDKEPEQIEEIREDQQSELKS
jgi:low affinity Fe/Cu permease